MDSTQKELDSVISVNPHPVGDNVIQEKLDDLGIKREDYEYLIGPGVKILEKPTLLSQKLKVPLEKAEHIIETIKSFKRTQHRDISEEDMRKIEMCLKESPQLSDYEDVALLCEVDQVIVSRYFESLPLTGAQKDRIKEKFNSDNSVPDISKLIGSSQKKVGDYVESTFLTFSCEEGKKCLQILEKYTKAPIPKLREFIISDNLKFRDEVYKMKKKDCEILKKYFLKFDESKSFFDVDMSLTMDDISLINQNTTETVEHLSNRINKVKTVVREYLEQYHPNDVVTKSCRMNQENKIRQLVTTFGENQLTLCFYRIIISNSFESMIEDAINKENQTSKDIFRDLLPMTFYYVKCNIPLEDVTQIIANTCNISLTTHELFHITFQLSDPVLRGFCIEHYSFSNPVPFYYPKLYTSSLTQTDIEFEFCKELWYSMEQYHGLVSFGLGRAGWNPIGKSSLLDLMFETDFVKGNPQNSSFHFNSIDIQMTRNLFGEKMDSSTDESIKWAYIDCHRHSNTDVIKQISKHLDIALIHLTQDDYDKNIALFNGEVNKLLGSVKHCYYFVRDYEGIEIKIENKRRDHLKEKYIFIPDLRDQHMNIHSVRKSLKAIGYEILHLKNPRLIGSEFLEQILKDDSLMDIQSDKRLVKRIIDEVCKQALISDKIEYPFLEYYPLFIVHMCCYYKAFYETCQSTIENLNLESEQLKKKLHNTKMGNIALYFNEIIGRENSSLLLWKLSQELALLSKQHSLIADSTHQQKQVKYSLEIFWREALLSTKYGKLSEKDRTDFNSSFSSRYSSYVWRGEPFELIDGDNLRYFDSEINDLLNDLYQEQDLELEILNEGQMITMKQAPIVVSIFGPQSSGKSTLLNYCFGCKFLTSAGRCTRGIYASLAQLSRPVNLTNQFLILDTEGLDGIERANIRDTSLIHFDRTMVLFCLAVSQVVIINVKGDIGNELQNLLEICAYSLNKLNVRKVAAPKIFFVLNQQADPDPDKHIDSINVLMDKLNGDLMDTEGVKISDLIQVSRENLFILPSAFNSEQMNTPGSRLFNSEVIKLSPTVTFADKCTKLRLAIIEQLDNMPVDDRTPFQTMQEWMDMSGIIWDTIVRYQDIVKYRNVEEVMCNNELSKLVSELMQGHIYRYKQEFLEITNELSVQIQKIETLTDSENLLTKFMIKFDEIFISHQIDCDKAFTEHCESNLLLKKNSRLCKEFRNNLSRLVYIEKKIYEDKLKFQIKAVSVEILLSRSMKKFQDTITKNVDDYLQLDHNQQIEAFEKTWMESFGEDKKEEVAERDETFENLYSIFRMESNTMESMQSIYLLFSISFFEMEEVISNIKSLIVARFMKDPNSFDGVEQFIFPCNENNFHIRYMVPYGGKMDYEYLSGSSLFHIDKLGLLGERKRVILSEWVPLECRPLVKYCSGHYRHPDIIWGSLDRKQQVLRLASLLKSPRNLEESTWEKLVSDICQDISNFIDNDPNISHGTVKQMVNYLSSLFKLVNYEINCIQAKLSDTAQRTITTLVFAFAYQSLWNIKIENRIERNAKTGLKKSHLFEYFSQKIKNRKIFRGDCNREKMKESDLKISKKFALDILESIKRGLFITEQPKIELYFNQKKEILSYEYILLTGNTYLAKELGKDPETEVLDQANFVIKYICDRNTESNRIFLNLWYQVQDDLHRLFFREMNEEFFEHIQPVRQVLRVLQDNLVKSSARSGTSEHKAWDSDRNFEVADMEDEEIPLEVRRESPFKAMVVYLQMYLNPLVLPAVFQDTFKQGNTFDVDGVRVQLADTYVLCNKPVNPVLSEEMFKKLLNTKMFSTENIFNLYDYVTEFLSVLNNYTFELANEEFSKLVQHIKEDFEKHAIGCPNQCPSCGKCCERELHPNDGLCEIKTGHQICSMGGKVWNNDEERTAVLFTCDDFKKHTAVSLPGLSLNWLEFTIKCCNDWNWSWSSPEDETNRILQYGNKVKMQDIWNKFGRGVLNYYADRGTHITYVPYASIGEVYTILQVQYYICFVIDGTKSMLTEIKKVRTSVGQFIQKFKKCGNLPRLKVVIYRDHCDKVLLEKYPKDNEFTADYLAVQIFLKTVNAYGGKDIPEAALDGLATAATHSDWKTSLGIKNIIIHIFDAPPHGAFPDPTIHDSRSNTKHCCCCNHGSICPFDWKRDVWGNIKKNKIQYYGINTGKRIRSFEAAMKENLEELCEEFQRVGKEVVNDAILEIFIDHRINF